MPPTDGLVQYSSRVSDAMKAQAETLSRESGKPINESLVIVAHFTIGPAIGMLIALTGKGRPTQETVRRIESDLMANINRLPCAAEEN